MKAAQDFLTKREQVRVVLVLRGRQKYKPNENIAFLEKLHLEYFEDFGKLAKSPTFNNLSLVYNPVSKK